MIDVHCHVNFHAYKHDADTVINEAFSQGVKNIICVGTQLGSSEEAAAFAKKYERIYAIVGVHPHHADKKELESDWITQLKQIATKEKVVAIGEVGLDYYSYKSNGIVDRKVQQSVFEAQIDLAHTLSLPLQIHNRHAGRDIVDILTHHKNILHTPPGMFHCFAGDMETLHKVLDLGFCVGFDGNITYPGLAPGETVSLSDLAKATPLDRIVTETDSPFLTPVPYRGQRNHPAYVIIIGEFLAKIKGVSFEELAIHTEENTKRMFHLQ